MNAMSFASMLSYNNGYKKVIPYDLMWNGREKENVRLYVAIEDFLFMDDQEKARTIKVVKLERNIPCIDVELDYTNLDAKLFNTSRTKPKEIELEPIEVLPLNFGLEYPLYILKSDFEKLSTYDQWILKHTRFN